MRRTHVVRQLHYTVILEMKETIQKPISRVENMIRAAKPVKTV